MLNDDERLAVRLNGKSVDFVLYAYTQRIEDGLCKQGCYQAGFIVTPTELERIKNGDAETKLKLISGIIFFLRDRIRKHINKDAQQQANERSAHNVSGARHTPSKEIQTQTNR